jgi:PPOX class probable F420-dependent enzyme
VTTEDAAVPSFAMTDEQITEFLAEPWFASVASLRRDGSPIIMYVGYEWDGEFLYFSLRGTRLLVKRLARDPRVSIAVTNTIYPPKFVTIQGEAEIVDDPGYERARRMWLRYMGPDAPTMTIKDLDLDAFWEAYTEVTRVLYRVRPSSIISEDAGKWDHEASGGAGNSDALARLRGDLPGDPSVSAG